jgi:hypothetical protein
LPSYNNNAAAKPRMRTCWSRWRGAEATGERKDGGQEKEMRKGGRLLDVTTQDFIKFWGKFFAFVLLEMFGNSQGFKTFESI